MPFLSRLKPNINPLFGGIGGQNPYSVTVRLSLSILATFPIGAQDTNMSFLSLLSYQVQGLQVAVLSLDKSLSRHYF